MLVRPKKELAVNNPSFESMRDAMIVSQLRTTGVSEPSLVAALGSVPRELFVEDDRQAVAYSDRAVAVGEGRFLLPPEALGKLLEKAAPAAGEKALIIGGSTGYSAAVLVAMGVDVTLVESSEALAAKAKSLLGDDVRTIVASLEEGTSEGGPFTLILIDGAVEEIPAALIALLAEGGRLTTVRIDETGVGRATLGRKVGSSFALLDFADVPPVARLPGFARARSFQF